MLFYRHRLLAHLAQKHFNLILNMRHTAPEQELNISKKNDQIGRIELFENLLTNFNG